MHEQTEKEDLTMKKRVLAALLCTSLTAGALAGCGSFGGKETTAVQKASGGKRTAYLLDGAFKSYGGGIY